MANAVAKAPLYLDQENSINDTVDIIINSGEPIKSIEIAREINSLVLIVTHICIVSVL